MYRATKDIIMPTTITGSLPRPNWYTENLGTRHFLEAMVSRRFREQYEDALTCYLRDQEVAGLDIVEDPHRRRLIHRRGELHDAPQIHHHHTVTQMLHDKKIMRNE